MRRPISTVLRFTPEQRQQQALEDLQKSAQSLPSCGCLQALCSSPSTLSVQRLAAEALVATG
jgi:hypothetical protein